MDDNLPKPRRWFRFSLRTMFVLVTVGCVAIPIVLHEVVQWTWFTIVVVTISALYFLPMLADICFSSAMDRWAANERKAEELRNRDAS
jgi:hypothetical protein